MIVYKDTIFRRTEFTYRARGSNDYINESIAFQIRYLTQAFQWLTLIINDFQAAQPKPTTYSVLQT